MSKTTLLLLFILILFLGCLLFVVYEPKKNLIITSLTSPSITQTSAGATLSLTTTTQTLHREQTVQLEIHLHNATPHPYLTQIELAYDPQMVTVTAITPGPFFTHPTIALKKIDSITGRITYALRCTDNETDCSNAASSTLATITISINPYAVKNTTTFSFLQKTVIRTNTNTDILKTTNGLQLTLNQPIIPLSSESANASQKARQR